MVQVLCGLGLVGRGPLGGELGWGEVAVGGVGPLPVVVDAPVLDDHSGFAEAVELPAPLIQRDLRTGSRNRIPLRERAIVRPRLRREGRTVDLRAGLFESVSNLVLVLPDGVQVPAQPAQRHSRSKS